MAIDQLDTVTLSVYGNDFTGDIDSTILTVSLSEGIVKYKSNIYLRSLKKEFTPDAITGKITMILPDTDNMEGNISYIFDFGNGVKYKSKVPYSAIEVNFWDLDLVKSNDKSFNPFEII
tara:strand:+ start:2682 stop:3038 length:357 start_codon:yes stop_codon:yes gene_type:complete